MKKLFYVIFIVCIFNITIIFSDEKIVTLNLSENTIINEGVGLDIIKLLDLDSKITELFGVPEKKQNFGSNTFWSYSNKYGIDFLTINDTHQITEIRFNIKFKGKTSKGLKIGSTIKELMQFYDLKKIGIVNEQKDLFKYGDDKVLIEISKNGNDINNYIYNDSKNGLMIWLNGELKVVQIIIRKQ